MRVTDYDKLQLKLREYADRKALNGEIELANEILKAKCFIDQECEVLDEKQLTNGWIPVTERLPKEGRYLVTTVYGEVKESEFDLKKWWQIDNSTISLEWDEEGYVLAWMPLPEPYKEG